MGNSKTKIPQVAQKPIEKTATQALTPETGAALFEDARSRLEDVFKCSIFPLTPKRG